jgi:glycosyltransferase involved in cell wall biosynthesis
MKQNQASPRVSVVIPTYRRPVELKRALESVLSQDFTDIEILVVDDNPPGTPGREATTRLLESLEGPLVHIPTEGSLGGAGARNVGIEQARGEYVAFLDDDDMWLPGKLRLQMELMESLPKTVCSVDTGFYEIDETRGTKKQVRPALRGEIFDDLLVKHKGRAPKLSSMLCRTAALREIGMFDASLPARQDLDLYLRLARKYSFEFLEDPLVIKYVHENDRITANVTSKIRAFDLFYRKYREDFLIRPRLHRIFLRKRALWLLYDRRFLKGTAQLLKSIFVRS